MEWFSVSAKPAHMARIHTGAAKVHGHGLAKANTPVAASSESATIPRASAIASMRRSPRRSGVQAKCAAA